MNADSERTPLSHREYTALKQLFGILYMWNSQAPELKKRLETIPGGWRDARMIATVSDNLLRKIFRTIPFKKLGMIKKELDNTTCEVKVKYNVGHTPPGEAYTYVPQGPLERVTVKAMEEECYLCDKTGKDCLKCPLKADIEALYMWDFPKVKDGQQCHFSLDRQIGGLKDVEI